MFILSTTQLQLLTWRPEPRPIYDEAVFIRAARQWSSDEPRGGKECIAEAGRRRSQYVERRWRAVRSGRRGDVLHHR